MTMLTEEQQLIKDSADRLVESSYSFEQRRARLEQGAPYSDEMWMQFAELGWLAIGLDEVDGGIGAGPQEMALIAQACGRGLVTEPFLSTVVLGGELIKHGAKEPFRSEVLGLMMAGEIQLATGFAERGSRYELNRVQTKAVSDGDRYRLNGKKTVVLNAGCADHIIVSARTSGAEADQQGISLFAVPAQSAGVTVVSYKLNDDHYAADVTLDNVVVAGDQLLGDLDDGYVLLEAVVDQASVIACAEAVGAMEAVMGMTLEYLHTREQFGRTLGSNQALKFRMVEAHYALEESRSMLAGALAALDSDATSRRAMVSAAKVRIGNAARDIGREGIQMHGAIGMTEDLAVGHYYKRLETLRMIFGDPDHHLARFGYWSSQRNSTEPL